MSYNGYDNKLDYLNNLGPRKLSPQQLRRQREDETRQRNQEEAATRLDLRRHHELFGD